MAVFVRTTHCQCAINFCTDLVPWKYRLRSINFCTAFAEGVPIDFTQYNLVPWKNETCIVSIESYPPPSLLRKFIAKPNFMRVLGSWTAFPWALAPLGTQTGNGLRPMADMVLAKQFIGPKGAPHGRWNNSDDRSHCKCHSSNPSNSLKQISKQTHMDHSIPFIGGFVWTRRVFMV